MTISTHQQEVARVTVQEAARLEEALENRPSTTVVPLIRDPRTANTALSDHHIEWLSPRKYVKVLVRLAGKVMAINGRLFGPPATEQDRIQAQVLKARHDRYISFFR